MKTTRGQKSPLQTIIRRMILIDMENANRGPSGTLQELRRIRQILINTLNLTPEDQVVIACNADAHSVFTARDVWGSAVRIVTGTGPSGADKALLDVMGENLEGRFDELVLVSGDGIFTDRVAALAAQGLPTHVVAHSMGLSRHLRLAATHLTFLPTHRMPHTSWKQGA